MIKCNMGSVSYEGRRGVLQGELTLLIHTLYDEKVATKKDIEDCVKIALMSEEEIEKEVNSYSVKDRMLADAFMKALFD